MISGGSLTAVGEVTNLTATTMAFANLDALNINQDGATSGNLKAIAPWWERAPQSRPTGCSR